MTPRQKATLAFGISGGAGVGLAAALGRYSFAGGAAAGLASIGIGTMLGLHYMRPDVVGVAAAEDSPPIELEPYPADSARPEDEGYPADSPRPEDGYPADNASDPVGERLPLPGSILPPPSGLRWGSGLPLVRAAARQRQRRGRY